MKCGDPGAFGNTQEDASNQPQQRLVFDQEYPPTGVLRDQYRKKTWSNRLCKFYPQGQCALGYFWSLQALGIRRKYGNSCKQAHFRHARTPENMAPSTTNRKEQPQPPSGASQSQWPTLPSRNSDFSSVPSQCFAPSQFIGNTTPPKIAQPSPQDGVAGTSTTDRDAWATMVTRILPLVVTQERNSRGCPCSNGS